jgi:ABC-2 type transport system permease protein
VTAVRRRRGVFTVYQWELEKLVAQLRVRGAIAACLLGPPLFVLVVNAQDTVPSDTLFGRWVHFSGLAAPLVALSFVTQWALPLLTCLVAGDIFAAEDHYGTWKTILTRSRGRAEIFWGKTLAAGTFCVVIVLLLALASTAAGVLVIGDQPLVSLSGTLIAPGRATLLVLASWGTALPPALGFTAMGLMFSIITRNSPAGMIAPAAIGLLMQLISLINGADAVRHALLTTPFNAWHGLLSGQPYYGPLWHGAIVSTVYLIGCLAAAYLALRRRDFTQG